jgi:hypothetical protein
MEAFIIIAGLSLAGLPAAAQQGSSQQQTGDPVADAARKAREAKKDAPKPKKVYTDDDVKTSAPEQAATTPATPGTASGAAAGAATTATPGNPAGATAATTVQAAGAATKPEDPNGESAWRKRFKEQREKIARTEKEIDVLQRELERAQTQYYTDPQKAMNEQNNRAEINAKTAKIDAKKKELDQLKQGLDDLEDQLRKSGGDPGWAR